MDSASQDPITIGTEEPYAQSVFQNTAATGKRGHGSAPAGPCGGVRHRRGGGYVCEALVRSGVGAFDLIDDDRVCLTNLNRQIIATRKTVGKFKAEVMAERIHDINPNAQVTVRKTFFLPENADEFPFDQYDYVVDAIDTVSGKLELVMRQTRWAFPSSAPWARGTSWIPPPSVRRTSTKPKSALWPGSCVGSFGSGAFRI